MQELASLEVEHVCTGGRALVDAQLYEKKKRALLNLMQAACVPLILAVTLALMKAAAVANSMRRMQQADEAGLRDAVYLEVLHLAHATRVSLTYSLTSGHDR